MDEMFNNHFNHQFRSLKPSVYRLDSVPRAGLVDLSFNGRNAAG